MSHKKQFINIKNLLVNPNNFRFDPVANQKEAINIMINKMKHKIKKQAEDIAKYGLNPTETLSVTKTYKGKYIVHEGNRRLTAIKLIDNPRIIPLDEKTKSFFQKLKENYGQNLPLEIECTVFSEEKETRHWIRLKHTGENKGIGVVSWNNKQQGRFEAHITDSKPKKHIQIQEVMNKYSIPLPDRHSTTLQRLIGSPDIRKKIGIDFEDGELKYEESNQKVVDNLKKISFAMNKSGFTVRKLDSKSDRIKWINEVLKERQPDQTIRRKRKGQLPKDIQIPNSRKELIPENLTINISQSRVNLIYNELQTLKIDKYRNAVAVLFRVFLELSINHFIEKKKKKGIDLLEELKQKNKDHKERKIVLRQKMKIVCKYMQKEEILTKSELQPVRIAIEKKYDISSIQTFNSYVHNLSHFPSDSDLKHSWDNMQNFIQKLWK